MKHKHWGVCALLAILAMVLNVLASFGWVWVYSLIEPGQTQEAYAAYAQQWAPVSSVVLGSPIMFALGWIAGRGRELKQAAMMGLAVGGIYVAIDLAIVLSLVFSASGHDGAWGWGVASWITKPLFGWLGGRVGGRKTARA